MLFGWMVALAAVGTPSSGVSEIACGVITQDQSGEVTTTKDPDLKVLEQTAEQDKFTYSGSENVVSIICGRSDIVPARHDDKVLAAGLTLNIVNDSRVGVLEVSGGQFRFRMLEGKLDEDEAVRVQQRLDEFQSAISSR